MLGICWVGLRYVKGYVGKGWDRICCRDRYIEYDELV